MSSSKLSDSMASSDPYEQAKLQKAMTKKLPRKSEVQKKPQKDLSSTFTESEESSGFKTSDRDKQAPI